MLISLVRMILKIILMIIISYLTNKFISDYQEKHKPEAIPKDDKPIEETSKKSFKLTKQQMKKHNAILIYGEIDMDTYTNFVNAYKIMDKNKDIYLLINSPGGESIKAMQICHRIMNHSGSGKFIACVPDYAFSGAARIALSCDKIYATSYTLFGPSDSQLHVDKLTGYYPVVDVINIVKSKQEKNEPVSEYWLAAELKAQRSLTRNNKFMDKLCKSRPYDKEKLTEELFSGKYSHEEKFTAEELNAMNFGLQINIIDKVTLTSIKKLDKIDIKLE